MSSDIQVLHKRCAETSNEKYIKKHKVIKNVKITEGT